MHDNMPGTVAPQHSSTDLCFSLPNHRQVQRVQQVNQWRTMTLVCQGGYGHT